MSGADTAWILTSTALVLFMTLPGLALFYAGLVRAQNVLSVLMNCFAIAATVSILWFVVAYSIAFGDGNAWWGGLGKSFLSGVDVDTMAGTIPENLFFMFQMTFAIITPALIVGAYPERIHFSFVIVFSLIWVALVYAPVVHWVWGWRVPRRNGPDRLRRWRRRPCDRGYFGARASDDVGATSWLSQ